MDFFSKAKVVRLRSHHDKYIVAEDEETVVQDKNGASKQARWTVEFVRGETNALRLKSCYGRYLTASNKPFLLGLTGHKVIQSLPSRLDSSVEWEPVRDGVQVKLKTRYGNFLRANGGTYPYRNSITHDVPHRTATQDWILWEVDVIDMRPPPTTNVVEEPIAPAKPVSMPPESPPRPARVPSRLTPRLSKKESSSSLPASPPKPNGRMIQYCIADDNGDVDESSEVLCFLFEGSNLQGLTQRLEEVTGLEGVIVCMRNLINGKLYPVRLHLPPNNAPMNVIVVQSSSKVAQSF